MFAIEMHKKLSIQNHNIMFVLKPQVVEKAYLN